MSGGAAYQQLVKEQLGVDLSKPAGPAPNTQPIPSMDPRDNGPFEQRSAAPVEEARGGGTNLSALLDDEPQRQEPPFLPYLDRTPEVAAPPLGRPAYAYEEPPRRPFKGVRTSTPEDADRNLGCTVAVIFTLLFSPALQAKLAEFLPSALVFHDSWNDVLVRAVILGLAIFAFRRFFALIPNLGRPPRVLERGVW